MTFQRLHHSTKWLGVYLLVLGLYHVGFYTSTFNKGELWLYLDPRFYSDMLLFGLIGERSAHMLGIVVGLWFLALSSMLITGRRPLIAYIASEVLLILTGLPVFGIFLVTGLAGGGSRRT